MEHVCGGVRSTDEDTFGKIKFDVEVVISESVALLGIQELEESSRNISLQRTETYFVDFINNNNWVLAFKFLNLFDKNAWLTVDISPL